mmetsp:Transcript_13925/g.43683  ORF Transcript_13925/g.43683 Transcript_13925/m.43683 type:complete len:299 (+) Transcript_13925:154-1050(+)
MPCSPAADPRRRSASAFPAPRTSRASCMRARSPLIAAMACSCCARSLRVLSSSTFATFASRSRATFWPWTSWTVRWSFTTCPCRSVTTAPCCSSELCSWGTSVSRESRCDLACAASMCRLLTIWSRSARSWRPRAISLSAVSSFCCRVWDRERSAWSSRTASCSLAISTCWPLTMLSSWPFSAMSSSSRRSVAAARRPRAVASPTRLASSAWCDSSVASRLRMACAAWARSCCRASTQARRRPFSAPSASMCFVCCCRLPRMRATSALAPCDCCASCARSARELRPMSWSMPFSFCSP